MIWSYALGGHFIPLMPKPNPLSAVWGAKDRFPLLRVCRQIYSEAALLPRSLSTVSFETPTSYSKYAQSGLIKHARHIRLGTIFWDLSKRSFSSPQIHDLRTIEITMATGFLHPGRDHGEDVRRLIDERSSGKHVHVRYVSNDDEYDKAWRGES